MKEIQKRNFGSPKELMKNLFHLPHENIRNPGFVPYCKFSPASSI
jgi:hypothetical protein